MDSFHFHGDWTGGKYQEADERKWHWDYAYQMLFEGLCQIQKLLTSNEVTRLYFNYMEMEIYL